MPLNINHVQAIVSEPASEPPRDDRQQQSAQDPGTQLRQIRAELRIHEERIERLCAN